MLSLLDGSGVPGFYSLTSWVWEVWPKTPAMAWELGDLTLNPGSITYLQINA